MKNIYVVICTVIGVLIIQAATISGIQAHNKTLNPTYEVSGEAKPIECIVTGGCQKEDVMEVVDESN